MTHIEGETVVLWEEDDLKQILGRNVKTYRKQRGMKQTDLGAGAGYRGHTQISNIEKGKVLPSLPHLIAISAYLQKSIDALLRYEPEPPALSDDLVYMLNQFPLEMREQIRTLLLMTHQWHVRSRGDDFLLFS
jgi:transcriptional regulator with XRE-family HTH domain